MIRRWLKALGPNGGIRIRFSQHGEDAILHKILNKKNGFYIDAGAYHPFRQSNTARLWCTGWNGINIDANPNSIKIFNKVRRLDTNIWGAIVSDETAEKESTVQLSFSKKIDLKGSISKELIAERNLAQKMDVPTISLKDVVNKHATLHNGEFDFLNVDVEGMDYAAVSSISKWKKQPSVIAIETYGNGVRQILENETTTLLEGVGYKYIYQIGMTSVYSKLK
jgi:FkbM family methyltransferase